MNTHILNRSAQGGMHMIYMDNAATTRTAPEVVQAMLPYFSQYYGNPSAVYSMGSANKKAINEARRTIAAILGAGQEEIYFTAGGSEADNWALKAAAEAGFNDYSVFLRAFRETYGRSPREWNRDAEAVEGREAGRGRW